MWSYLVYAYLGTPYTRGGIGPVESDGFVLKVVFCKQCSCKKKLAVKKKNIYKCSYLRINMHMINIQMMSTLHTLFETYLGEIMLSQSDHPKKCGSQDDRAWKPYV